MDKLITITENELNVLRETLKKADQIINRLGLNLDGVANEREAIKKKPKITRAQNIDRFDKMISSGKRATKPEHLKRKNHLQ